MKRTILPLILIIVFAFGSYAQKISGGIVASPVVSWIKPDSKKVEMDGISMGFNFGLVGDYNASDNFAIGAGLLVNKYGGSVKYLEPVVGFDSDDIPDSLQNFPTNTQFTYNLTYIELPISLKGKTNEIGYITYFMKAGVSPAFRYKAKADANANQVTDVDARQEASLVTFGYHLGGGIEYSLGGSTKILVELDWTGGLSDITKANLLVDGAEKNEMENLNYVALRLGILF